MADQFGLASAIYVMDADGGNVLRVSELGGHALNPVWSPDDNLIAYQSNIAHAYNDIYVYELETEQTRLVTTNEGERYDVAQDTAPTWICDSTVMVFTSDIEGDNNLYSVDVLPIDAPPVNVDEAASRLTDSEHNDRDPQNSPPEENASRAGSVPPKYTGN